ncbi:MAG: hypothetical protein N3A54_02530 [Patescibacteria group bacterium]|nr:hypothetical protein [Patescibacteria group bacterium]
MEKKIIYRVTKDFQEDWQEIQIYSIWNFYLFFNKNEKTYIEGRIGDEFFPLLLVKKNNEICWAKDTQEKVAPEEVIIYRLQNE